MFERFVNAKWAIRDPALKIFIPETKSKCPVGRKQSEGKEKACRSVRQKANRLVGGPYLSSRTGGAVGRHRGSCDPRDEGGYSAGRVPFTTSLKYQ